VSSRPADELVWQRGRSCDGGACVEIARLGDAIILRNSINPNGTSLTVSRDEWRSVAGGLQRSATKKRSATKISRIETGARRASLRDVRDLCGIYGVSPQGTADLMDLAHQARELSWWTHYEDLRFFRFIGMEQDADASTVLPYIGYRLCCRPRTMRGQ
jgi:hypothetical protein